MPWNETVQPRVVEQLQKTIERNRLAHAYIFFGPKGTGKNEIAYELARAVNCERKNGEACGVCATCLQIAQGNHPDVFTIQPDGAFIKINQIRELQARCRLSPPQGFTRIVVLKAADRMRDEAANSLLKFLEEPTSTMISLLLTENPSDILPTIQSRCHRIRFPELPPEAKAKQFVAKGIPVSLAHVYASLPHAYDLDEKETDEMEKLCLQIAEWGEQILQGGDHALLSLTEEWLRKQIEDERTTLVLDLLLLWFRKRLLSQLGKKTHVYDFESLKKENRHNADLLLMAIDNVQIARRLLVKPGLQEQAILEQMVLAIQAKQLSMDNGWQLIPIAK